MVALAKPHYHLTVYEMAAVLSPSHTGVTELLGNLQRDFESVFPLHWRAWLKAKRGVVYPPGLAYRIAEIIRAAGDRLEVEDCREASPAHEMELSVPFRGSKWTCKMLTAARDHHGGQIELLGRNDLLMAMQTLCRGFPAARIVLMTGSRSSAEWIRHELKPLVTERIDLAMSGSQGATSRITVCTPKHLNEVRWDGVDVLLLPYPADAISQSAMEAFYTLTLTKESPRPLRTYALLPPHPKLHPRDQLRLEAMAGPVMYRREENGAHIDVSWVQTTLHPPRDHLVGLERKRAMLWHNPTRNEFLADIAHAFAANDIQRCWEHGLLLNETQDYLKGVRYGRRVTLVVESVEHARALLPLLPGWMFYCCKPGLEKRPPTELGQPAGDLVTSSFFESNPMQAKVLIRADGMGGIGALAGHPPHESLFNQIYLVDLVDDFDQLAQQAAASRLQAYQQRRWTVPPLPVPVERTDPAMRHSRGKRRKNQGRDGHYPDSVYPGRTKGCNDVTTQRTAQQRHHKRHKQCKPRRCAKEVTMSTH